MNRQQRDSIVAAALATGTAAFIVTFIIGVLAVSTWRCDGLCTDTNHFLVAAAAGVFFGVAAAWIAWERVTRGSKDR